METRKAAAARSCGAQSCPQTLDFPTDMGSSVHNPGEGAPLLPDENRKSPPEADSDQVKRCRIGEVVGASNGRWQRSLRLKGITRITALKKVQMILGEGMEAPVDFDLHRSGIFPFNLFSSQEAEKLTTATVQELAADLPNREKAGVITDGPFHLKGMAKYAKILRSRHMQPLDFSSTLQRAVCDRTATLLQ